MRQHAFIWLIITLIAALVLPVLTSKITYKETLTKEVNAAIYYFGQSDATTLVRNTNKVYQRIIDATYIEQAKDAIAKVASSLPKRRDGKVLGFFDVPPEGFRKSLDSPIFSIYLLCWRLEHYQTWMLYIWPVLIALVFDGLMTRKVRAAGKHYSSPSRYNMVWHLLIALAPITLILMFAGVPLPIFSFPVVIVIFGMLIRDIAASLQSSA